MSHGGYLAFKLACGDVEAERAVRAAHAVVHYTPRAILIFAQSERGAGRGEEVLELRCGYI